MVDYLKPREDRLRCKLHPERNEWATVNGIPQCVECHEQWLIERNKKEMRK